MQSIKHTLSRRSFLRNAAATGVAPWLASSTFGAASNLGIASFRFDVTPPLGHPLCGGWIKPASTVDDALEAIGYVITGTGKPIVVCSVDWTGILNEAHLAWREALASAANTTADRVAVHCVHQHDAPFVCLHAERLIASEKAGLSVVQTEYFSECLKRGASAVKAAMSKTVPLTHIATAETRIHEVASNRRIAVDKDGKVRKGRTSSCRDPELVAMPEGLIDPMMKSIGFYSGDRKVVVSHYYATHPMSHYGAGRVSSDFPGLARKQRQSEDPNCTHLYFTGCSGDVTAGKYNDGSPEARLRLTKRIHDGMLAAEKQFNAAAIKTAEWRTHEILPECNPLFLAETLQSKVADPNNVAANRIRPAMVLGWQKRLAEKLPIVLSSLKIGDVSLLHLPAESFVAYQLKAQALTPSRFVATAAYGDGGPWYIPLKSDYPKGGYEVGVANCSDSIETTLMTGIADLLRV
jgi:hypothetical protein